MRENRYFVLSGDLTGLAPVMASGKPAISYYSYLAGRLEAICGRGVAELFAEPVLPIGAGAQPTAVSWYGPQEGRPIEIDSIDDIARRPIADRLAESLNALAPALKDRDVGPLLAASLSIPSNKSILAIGNQPLLVNWGYLPQEAVQDGERRAAHFAATLGRFAPQLTPLVAAALGTQAAAAQVPPEPSPETGSTDRRPPFSQRRGADGQGGGDARAWVPPLIASIIAGAVLLILLLPGVLAYPDASSSVGRDDFEAERLKRSNEFLEAQLKVLQNAARDRVCRAGEGETIPVPGFPPSDPDKSGDGKNEPKPQMELLPRAPERVSLPPRPGETAQAANIAEALEKSTVFVVAPLPDKKVSFGTGFFINDRYIVTNHHVVEHASDHVLVASKIFNGVRAARVVAKTEPPPNETMSVPDFAVLEIEPVGGVTPLHLGVTPPKLSTAYIAGFPFFLISEDAAYKKLLSELHEALALGDDDQALAHRRLTVPGVDLRYGRVNNIMTLGPAELPIIIHDMQIAPGNSGGPLVDACGRLAGVNTAHFTNIARDATSDVTKTDTSITGIQQGNVAQSAGVLRKFLSEKQIPFTPDDNPCPPRGPIDVSTTPGSGAACWPKVSKGCFI